MEEFEWAKCIKELHKKAPMLLCLLSTIIVQHNDHRNVSKRGDRHNPGISIWQ